MIVRVRGVKKVRAKGRIYYYHRKTGSRIEAPYRSLEFAAEVGALDQQRRPPPERPAGTLGALISRYRKSPEYKQLAPRTRSDYEKVFDWLSALDGMPVAKLDGAAVIALRDKTFAQKKRRFTNHTLQVLGTLMNWGEPRKLSPAYPLAGRKRMKIARPKDLAPANRPWSDAETAAVLAAAKGGLRVAIALAVYAGMRGGDIVRVTWSAYDGHALTWQQGKTGAEVWLPCLPELKAILDAAVRTATTIATRQDGRPMTEAGLRKAFRTLILRLLEAGTIAPGLTLHGRRHTLGTALIDRGGDLKMVQAVLGQKSIAAAQHYSQSSDRRLAAAAAVHLLQRGRTKVARAHGKQDGKPRRSGG